MLREKKAVKPNLLTPFAHLCRGARRKITFVMDAAGVTRLQIVSSIGIGNSYDQCKRLSFVFSRIIMPYVIPKAVKHLNVRSRNLPTRGAPVGRGPASPYPEPTEAALEGCKSIYPVMQNP